MNGAKIKILAIKGKDLEKSRVMMTSYIITLYMSRVGISKLA